VKVDRIWLQGEEALIPILPLDSDSIRYRIPGMSEDVELRDYREAGRRALEAARTAEGARQFHENFDTAALLMIDETESRTTLSLYDLTDIQANRYDMLWIAARVTDRFPRYWPIAWHLEQKASDQEHSFIAVLE
jgi:hypothetical protein